MIVRIDLATRRVSATQLESERIHEGGRYLTSRIIAEEVPPTCHPLGRANKLVLACGALAGSLVSSVNRLSIGAKSPLTGGIKESNAGGTTGMAMGRLGIRALILEGKTEAALMQEHGARQQEGWVVLHVRAGGIVFQSGDDLAGLGVYAKAEALRQRFGDKVAMTLVGPAGEWRMHTAGITNADPEGVPSRYNGRGGLGAVMASKGVQAIVWDAEDCVRPIPADKAAFMALNKEVGRRVNATPQTAEVYRNYGTAATMATTQSLGALPTHNFSRGRFDGFEQINGKRMHDIIKQRGGEGRTSHACMKGCLIQCSNIFPDAAGKSLCSPVEYENLGLLGSNLDIADLDSIARINWLCNDLGCDTIEIGAALGVAMDAGIFPFGDAGAVLETLEGLRQGTAFGRVIGAGAGVTGVVFGCQRVPTVKNQSMAAYDPRGLKGLGVTYATTTQGADHTAGNVIRAAVKHHLKEGQTEASRKAQHAFTLLDNMGICIMLGAALGDMRILTDLIKAWHGCGPELAQLQAEAEQTLERERQFNIRAGLSAAADSLPEFMTTERNPDSGAVFDFTPEELRETLRFPE